MNGTTLAKVPSPEMARRASMLLAANRVRVLEASAHMHSFQAEVQSVTSPGTTYMVGYGYPRHGTWSCECVAHKIGRRECSHIVACALLFEPEAQRSTPVAAPAQVSSWHGCAHRADFASSAEHQRDCPWHGEEAASDPFAQFERDA